MFIVRALRAALLTLCPLATLRENLANLEELPETGAWVIALPMKIAGGSGGPLRAAALLPK